jgi:pimeloyl-ACP methyl ester carboxylesterase
MVEPMYTPRKLSRTHRLAVRDADYLVRTWGSPESAPLVLLHGTHDTSITFQFLVDALAGDWYVAAPDWRGHGGTRSANGGAWFHDYLADLDALLEALFAHRPVNLAGHSLGGNLASTFAGLRPERVRRMIALDAFGIPDTDGVKLCDALSKWIQSQAGDPAPLKIYHSIEDMAQSLCRANPRLRPDQALYLAAHSSRAVGDAPGRTDVDEKGGGGERSGGAERDDAGFAWRFDLTRRRSMPTFHSLDEWIACWSRIRAPTLWVAAMDAHAGTVRADAEAFSYVLDHIGREHVIYLPDTGHNVQHDAPGPLAKIIESFLTAAIPAPQPLRATL